MAQDILSRTPPPADQRLPYGSDPNQFGELRLPKGASGKPAALMNIHGGFWRSRYDLLHAGELCAALAAAGIATFNLEYRRVGNEGGGWPATFDDIRSGWRFFKELADKHGWDRRRLMVMGHSAGGQLAIALAAHEPGMHAAISMAGVLDLEKCYSLRLSNDAVVGLLGGTPQQVPEHYQEASPMSLSVPKTVKQLIVAGDKDDIVPPAMSRDYVARKKVTESVKLLEIAGAGHFDLIDPHTAAWKAVLSAIASL
jgi:acetyl esterase/lipase